MKKHLKAIFVLAFLLFFITAKSQDDQGLKLRVGLNLGAQLPNKSFAQFLDGSHPNGVNRILTDYIVRPQLEELFGYQIIDWSFPANLKYDISLLAGGYLGLNIDEDFSIILNFNLSKVKTNEVLVINLDNPKNIQGQKELANISSEEQRFDLSLGIENVFNEFGPLEFYGAGGGLLNYIKLERHELIIRDSKRYSIMRIPPIYGQNRTIDGFGYGVFGQLGTRYRFSEKFSFDIGINLDLVKNAGYVNALVENTGYPSAWVEDASKFKLNGSAYFRIIWN